MWESKNQAKKRAELPRMLKTFFTSLHDREGKALLHISWFSIINCLVFTGINDVFVVANEDLPKIISLMRIRLLPVRTEFRFFLLHFSY